MFKNFFNVLLLVASVFLFSCSKNDEKKIRIVDLQGKPHNVKTRTPELNNQLLQSQTAQQAYASNYNMAPSQTNYMAQNDVSSLNLAPSQNQNQAPNKYATADYDAAARNVVEQTLQAPVNPSQNMVASAPEQNPAQIQTQNQVQSGEPKILATIGQKQEFEVQEISLNDSNKPKETLKKPSKKSAKSNKKNSKLKSTAGYFVQVGAFSSNFKAENSLAEMEKFSSGKVEEADMGDKKIYRALLGPFSNKSEALNLMNEIKNSGHDAVIVKRK